MIVKYVKNYGFIVVKACGFCNRGYDCYNVTITSYKHTHHPFYLVEVLKDSTKCLICDELLHPDWWISWFDACSTPILPRKFFCTLSFLLAFKIWKFVSINCLSSFVSKSSHCQLSNKLYIFRVYLVRFSVD